MGLPAPKPSDLDLDDPRAVTILSGRIWRTVALGALTAIGAVVPIAFLSLRIYVPGRPIESYMAVPIVVFVALYGVAVVGGIVVTKVAVKRAFSWQREDRPPDRHDIRRVAGLPRVAAGYVLCAWTVLVPAFFVWADHYIGGIAWERTVPAVALMYGVTGVAAGTVAYLLTELRTRPVVSQLLVGNPEAWPRAIGVSARLILTALVFVAPMLVIAAMVLSLSSARLPSAKPAIIAGCVMFSALGIVIVAIAGRALTKPIEGLHRAFTRVESGDLEARVDVLEGSELGLLQAGFNRMVDGLRERERLRDVFGRHVGTDVARLAMENDFGSGGHQCEATVLFVDIIGSTGLAQHRDPDAVVEILNRFFDAVVRCVGAEGGFVNKFQGDGALCIFGAPVPQDDHAARGLRAARSLAEELAPIGDVAAALGASSGPVVAGNVGAIDRYEFTVVGDPVNEASRLTDEAKLHRSHVLVSERTILAAGIAANGWIRGEAIALRGRSQPTITYSTND